MFFNLLQINNILNYYRDINDQGGTSLILYYLSAAVKISYRDAITIVQAWLHHESNG